MLKDRIINRPDVQQVHDFLITYRRSFKKNNMILVCRHYPINRQGTYSDIRFKAYHEGSDRIVEILAEEPESLVNTYNKNISWEDVLDDIIFTFKDLELSTKFKTEEDFL